MNFVEYFSVAAAEDSGGSNRSRSELEQQSSAFFCCSCFCVIFGGFNLCCKVIAIGGLSTVHKQS